MAPRPELVELLRGFVPPSGLGSARPRDVRLTGRGLAVVAMAVLLLVGAVAAGLTLYAQSIRQTRDRRLLAESGVDVDARVTRLWRSDEGKSKQSRVAYQFDADGRTHEGQLKMSLAAWRTLEVGARLSIRYLPANPGLSVLGGAEPRVTPLWVPWAAAAPIAAGGLICLFVLRAQRRLLAEGRAAPAVVTAHVKHHSQHGTHRSMKYDFPLMSGAVASGTCGTSSKPPEIGSVVCVLYDPDRPRRNSTYPLALVTPRVA